MIKKILKGLFTALLLIFAVYVVFQGYTALYPPFKSEVAVLYTVTDSVACSGIAVRDETIIDNSAAGILNYRVNDGDKVAKESVVADVFPTKEVARNMMTLRLLQDERDALQEMLEAGRSAGTNLGSVSAAIVRQMARLSASIDDGNLEGLEENGLLALDSLGAFYFSTAGAPDLEGMIAALDTQIEYYQSLRHDSSGEISTANDGYFVTYTDGFERLANKDSVMAMSVQNLLALLQSGALQIDNNSCKVVSDYTWYFAALIDSAYAGRFYEGQRLSLDLNYALVKDLPVRIERMQQDEEQTMLVFSSEYLNSDLTGLRLEEGVISFRNFKGIRVPRSAIRVLDETVGVYTKYDSKVRFKAIDVIYEADDYVLVEPSLDSSRLNLYDEVILEGKDLYVGKSLG